MENKKEMESYSFYAMFIYFFCQKLKEIGEFLSNSTRGKFASQIGGGFLKLQRFGHKLGLCQLWNQTTGQ